VNLSKPGWFAQSLAAEEERRDGGVHHCNAGPAWQFTSYRKPRTEKRGKPVARLVPLAVEKPRELFGCEEWVDPPICCPRSSSGIAGIIATKSASTKKTSQYKRRAMAGPIPD
jgi:hypothetical protein